MQNAGGYAGDKMIRSRTGDVLNILVGEYIKIANPVGSQDIARRLPVKVSPATIRNEMAELEDEGYIRRPHVSAGGVPSDKGYRFYVESLDDVPEPPVVLQRQIKDEFAQAQRDVEAWIHVAASVLSRVADNMAIVTFPRASASRIKYVQLVYLQEYLAMLVIVLQEARLRQHLLTLDEPTSQSDLTQVANLLNDSVSGLTYPEIEQRELELTPLGDIVRTETVSILKDIDNQTDLEPYVDGLRLLLAQPEFAETRRATEVVEILEERVLLSNVLSEASGKASTVVFIGEENQAKQLRPFSVILSQYGIPQEVYGTIGVIGPTRIEYASVIGGVRYLSSFMSELIMGVHGRS